MLKKTMIFLLTVLMVSTLAPRAYALGLSAQSAVLIEAQTGRVLYSHNSSQPLPMASTTKIMTALIALENGNLDDYVTVSLKAAYQEGSSMYLKIDEKVRLEELLYGLMLSSGNDAAVAIAEHIAGDVPAFAAMMTKRAKELGAVNTEFKNPNGLDEEGHITTAQELALITREALKNPTFAKIVATKQIKMQRGTYTNHNKMLSYYEGATGVKTGYTKKCGRTLVSSAERNGLSLIAVTLNAPDDWNDHMRMFDMAYSKYQMAELIEGGASAGSIMVAEAAQEQRAELIYENDISFYLSDEEKAKIEIVNNIPPMLEAPVISGQAVGSADVYLDGTLIGECNILCGSDIEKHEDTFMTALYNTFIVWLKAYR